MQSRLLERERELAALDAALADSQGANGTLVLIQGPPGIGKTALVQAAGDRAEEAGFLVLSARGAELERDFPLGVVRQLFEPALLALGAGERSAVTGGSATVGARALAGEPVDLFDALHGTYWLLANFAEAMPVLVVVDDAQWSDAASLRWCSYAANRLDGLRVAVVVATRTGLLDTVAAQALDAIRAVAATRVLEPSSLSEGGAAELLEGAFANRPDAAFVTACHSQTAGNPLMLRELAKALLGEAVTPDADAAALVTALPPRTALRAVHLRLGRLPAAAAAMARAVAVLETDVVVHDAAALAELEPGDAAEAADALVAAGILVPGAPLRFVHPLLRAAVYEEIAPARRAAMHAQAAARLRAAPELRDRVAAHLLMTDPWDEPWIVEHLRASAATAMAVGTPESAVVYLRRALQERPAAEIRPGVLAELAIAEMTLDSHAAVAHFEEAVALATQAGQRTPLLRGLGNALVLCGRVDEAYAALEQARAEVGDRELGLAIEAELLGVGLMAPALAPKLASRIAALPPLPGDTPGERVVLANLARHHVLIGAPAARTADVATRALAEGALIHEGARDSATFPLAVAALTSIDRFDDARAMVELSLAEARRRGSPLAHGLSHILLIFLELRSGDLDAAAEHARVTLELSRQVGFLIGVQVAASGLVEVATHRGELDAGDALLAECELTGDLPELVFSHSVLYARGFLRLAQGRRAEGLRDLFELGRRERLAGHACQDWLWRTIAAPALATDGDREGALALADEELEAARRRGAPDSLARALRASATVRGGDIELLREAVGIVEGTPLKLTHAYAVTDLGATLRRSGARTESREHLRIGLDLATRCGATVLAAHAEQELRATGARPRSVMRSGVESLTVAERRVADLAATGKSNKEIAQALFVTTKTIETQLASVYRKLDIASRKDLPAALG